jgi:hypothetical protein
MWREQPDRREVHGTIGEQLEDDGEPARGSGDLDTVVGLPLGEAQRVAAVDEERWVTVPQVDLARVQLREVRNDLGRHVTLAGNEGLHLRHELGIGKASERSKDIVLHIIF